MMNEVSTMIIAHLARCCYPFHPFGGLEQHVYQLTRELARLGHNVHLYTQPPDDGMAPIDFKWPEGVEHHFLPYQFLKLLRRNSIADRLLNYPVYSLRLAKLLQKQAPLPQIVHAHGLTAFGYSMLPLPGVPLILNPHGMEEFKNRSGAKQLAYAPFRHLVRVAAHRSSAVIATDQALVQEVTRFLEVAEDKIYVIPNALDLENFDQKLAQAQYYNLGNIDKPSLLLLSVGRLEENKGYSTGLIALRKLSAELPTGWHWVIVGEGSREKQLKGEATSLGLADNVTFIGRVSDGELYSLYRQADIFVQPTLYEGSSVVTLEALAARLPVVASATGGIPDKLFESGRYENGRLAIPGDPVNLADKLRELLNLPASRRHTLGQNGRYLVEDFFSWRAAGQLTSTLYETITYQCQATTYKNSRFWIS